MVDKLHNPDSSGYNYARLFFCVNDHFEFISKLINKRFSFEQEINRTHFDFLDFFFYSNCKAEDLLLRGSLNQLAYEKHELYQVYFQGTEKEYILNEFRYFLSNQQKLVEKYVEDERFGIILRLFLISHSSNEFLDLKNIMAPHEDLLRQKMCFMMRNQWNNKLIAQNKTNLYLQMLDIATDKVDAANTIELSSSNKKILNFTTLSSAFVPEKITHNLFTIPVMTYARYRKFFKEDSVGFRIALDSFVDQYYSKLTAKERVSFCSIICFSGALDEKLFYLFRRDRSTLVQEELLKGVLINSFLYSQIDLYINEFINFPSSYLAEVFKSYFAHYGPSRTLPLLLSSKHKYARELIQRRMEKEL